MLLESLSSPTIVSVSISWPVPANSGYKVGASLLCLHGCHHLNKETPWQPNVRFNILYKVSPTCQIYIAPIIPCRVEPLQCGHTIDVEIFMLNVISVKSGIAVSSIRQFLVGAH